MCRSATTGSPHWNKLARSSPRWCYPTSACRGWTAIALAHELRLLPGLERVRLIAISGYGQAEDHRRSMEAGFEQHLLKPVAPETLAELL